MSDPIQAGMTNDALLEAWRKKLPGVEPTDRELTAFALGVEVGFQRVPPWWTCPTHGPATRLVWGCPECVREMREHLTRQNNTA